MHYETVNRATQTYPFLIEHVDVRYIPHFHPETELVYVLEGSLRVSLENSSFLLRKDEICIIPSDLIHNLYTLEASKTFVMKLYPASELENIRLSKNVFSPGEEHYAALSECISAIFSEEREKRAGYEFSVRMHVEKIFLIILRNLKYRTLEDSMQSKLNLKNDFFRSVNLFLEAHYAEDFSLEEVSEAFHYTKSYFCHYFKKTVGVTFWNYYTVFRLEKAIRLMKSAPEKKMLEISECSGFRNIRSFNQSFKKYYRCTPKEYGKKYVRFDG